MRTSLVAIAIAALPTVAAAGPIEIKLVGMGPSEVVTVGGVRNVTAYAGEIMWMDASGDLSNLDNLFYSYCVDLLSNAQSTQQVTEELVSNSAVAWLYNQFAATAHLNAAAAAGLQLAIWNALYDGDFTVNLIDDAKNLFYLQDGSDAARGYANDYLSQARDRGSVVGNGHPAQYWLGTGSDRSRPRAGTRTRDPAAPGFRNRCPGGAPADAQRTRDAELELEPTHGLSATPVAPCGRALRDSRARALLLYRPPRFECSPPPLGTSIGVPRTTATWT